MSIFGLIHKPENLTLYLDKDLREADLVGRHPNRNDATIIVSHETLVQYLDIVGVEVKVIDVENMEIITL